MKFDNYDDVKLVDWNLVRDDSGPYRVYRDTDGNEYTSVTSFVGRFSSGKDELEKWKSAIGEIEANKIMTAAATRGTAIHEGAESILRNTDDWKNVSFFYKDDLITLKRELELNVNKVFALEHQMFSKKIKLAGTVDCIAEYKKVMSIIDFKTSSRIKYRDEINSYFLQMSAYAIMVYERYGIAINNMVILMVIEGDPKIAVFEEPTIKWAKQLLQLTKEYNV